MREVEEWIGKTDDTRAPPHVRLRVFNREDGRCHISGRKIRPGEPWDLDHKKALCNGGENRESNLFPALRDKHKEKTADDVAERALVNRKRSKHIGATDEKRGFRKPPPGYSPWKRRMEMAE